MRTAPLDAWYIALLLSVATMPSWDEMLMMEPLPAFRISGMAAFVPRKTPFALMSMTRSQSSTGVSSIRPPTPPMPALLTRMCSAPKRETVCATASCQLASLVTSSGTKRHCPPLSFISASTLRPSSSRTSPIPTFAPSRAKRRASSAPMPLAPPLMNATLPSSLPIFLPPGNSCQRWG